VAISGIITAALFSFTLSWGEYLYSITFVTDSWEKTIPSAVVGELIRGDVYYWGELMAGALLGSVPMVMIYVFFLDYYVSGLTAGGDQRIKETYVATAWVDRFATTTCRRASNHPSGCPCRHGPYVHSRQHA
jgi:hypothetical protein